MLWLRSSPKPRLPWHDYEGGSVTNVGDCYLRVEVADSYEVTA